MNQVLVFFFLIFAAVYSKAAPQKTVNLNCRAASLQPIHYKASLQGPLKSGFYKLKFAYIYYGAELNYDYDLKKIKNTYIAQKARVYNLIPQKNGTIRLYIETEKDGPVDMICTSK